MQNILSTGPAAMTRRAALAGVAAAGAALAAPSIARGAQMRIVTIGCGITETVFALGRGRDVVATDAASAFPHEAAAAAKLSYPKALVAERALAQRPDVVLVADEAGPRAALDAIAADAPAYLRLPETKRIRDIAANARLVADAIGESARGGALARDLEDDLGVVEEAVGRLDASRRALALLGAPDAFRVIVGGRGSPAAIALGFAGAANAAEAISGWSWMDPAVARGFGPQAVVSLYGEERPSADRVLAAAAMRGTEANRERRAAIVDASAFLGFGPRSAHAIHAVVREIYPEIALAPLPARPWTEAAVATL